jgi:hypothetical protein
VWFETRPPQILKENRDRPRPGKQVAVKKKTAGEISIRRKDKALKIKEAPSNKEVKQSASGIA